MNSWAKKTLIALTFAVIIIIFLAILNWRQEIAKKKLSKEYYQQEQVLTIDRASADRLFLRLQNLKKLRDELVMPQVELRIKF